MLRGYPTNIKLSLPGMHINDIESRLRDSYMIRCTGNWPAGKLTATLVVALLMFNGRGRVNSSNCVEVSTQIAHETEPNTKSTNQIILLQMADKTQSLTLVKLRSLSENTPVARLDTVQWTIWTPWPGPVDKPKLDF